MQFRSAQHLVVDTSAFINSVQLHNVGEKICTVPEVIDEIRNRRQYRHLFSLTHDVEIKTAFGESLHFVTEFAKKTGDYASLSSTDLKLIALTYQLETQFVGHDHIRKSPIVKQFKTNVKVKNSHTVSNNGLCLPVNVSWKFETTDLFAKPPYGRFTIENYERKQNKLDARRSTNNHAHSLDAHDSSGDEVSSDDAIFHECETLVEGDDYDTANESLSDSQEELNIAESEDESDIVESEDESNSEEGRNSDSEDESSDDDSWITPQNMSDLKRSAGCSFAESTSVTVGCLTTDFAIQNVLMQMGLNVITVDGKVIRELRTYILRCYACFKTTINMRKVFCPSCGNKTLKRVSVFVDKDGNKCMYINFKKNISTRGKRFSLPMPKGGKHAVNPKLVEDAKRPHQKPTKLARTKTNALDEDYIAGWSPFATRDVQSKSAQLGFNKGKPVFKYWMRKNPNQSKRLPKK